MWVKHPDYERVDWINKFVLELWPSLDKAICDMIRDILHPIFDECIRQYCITSIEFRSLTLGSLPPNIQGVKVHETNEKELIIDPIVRWAGNPNINLVVKFLFLPITLQLLDLQIFAAPRITLKPLVPTFPCFASIAVSLLDKPSVDFGLKLLGGDVMAIPGLYQFIQEQIRTQIANMYLWPQNLVIPILDESLGAIKKPVGILYVKVVKAVQLLKKDLLGASDPYVKLSLSGERLTAKKTSVKMKNLNPEWNEEFRMTVKDPKSQFLKVHVYDWEKIGKHNNLGMQVVPLSLLVPHQKKELTLDLMKNISLNNNKNKYRGKLVLELTFNPFKEDSLNYSGRHLDNSSTTTNNKELGEGHMSRHSIGGLLIVTIPGAENVEGNHHNNPYALVTFRGEEKRTKLMKKTRNPKWNEEFQFVLDEPPLKEKIHIQVMSRRTGFGFRPKETLGHVEISLVDVIHNGRINQKYHLINSKSGFVSVDIRWKVI
ncbi:unnamed protein product [Linum tenue]|uniref:Synaptotagmin-3-like n=4 Tax=Linum tenue TaxID=586396 RepID=A0AAV0L0J6_9ROSI|nr:unnamed protein product [Linum tenue]